MNFKQILFTDLDGTLLDDRKEITTLNREAIDLALNAGRKIVISTGRPLPSARAQAQCLNLIKKGCYAITYNGAMIYDLYQSQILHADPLPTELVKPMFRFAHDSGLHIQTYNDTSILSEYEREELKQYASVNLLPYQIVPDIEKALPDHTYKLIVICDGTPEHLKQFQQKVNERYGDLVDTFYSSPIYLEIVAKNVSKGKAVHWLCDYLNVSVADSVAVGDAENDISMIKEAGIGAVMCNASESIRKYGDYITTSDNNHDGVAEIIHRFFL